MNGDRGPEDGTVQTRIWLECTRCHHALVVRHHPLTPVRLPDTPHCPVSSRLLAVSSSHCAGSDAHIYALDFLANTRLPLLFFLISSCHYTFLQSSSQCDRCPNTTHLPLGDPAPSCLTNACCGTTIYSARYSITWPQLPFRSRRLTTPV